MVGAHCSVSIGTFLVIPLALLVILGLYFVSFTAFWLRMERRHMDVRLESRYVCFEFMNRYFEKIEIETSICIKDFGPGGVVLENATRFSDILLLHRHELRYWLDLIRPPYIIRSAFENDNEWTQTKDFICSYAQLMPGAFIKGQKIVMPSILVQLNLERWRMNDDSEAAVMAQAVATSMDIEEYRPMPATEAVIEALDEVSFIQDEQSCCTICLENLPVGSLVTRLPCTHVFHGNCIRKWLQKRNLCPLCRFWV